VFLLYFLGSPFISSDNLTTLPDCVIDPDSPTPYMDQAICVLESYPLIDG